MTHKSIHLLPPLQHPNPTGHFVNALISFICVCTILYFVVVLPLNTLMKFLYVPPKKTRECPE